MRLYNTLTRREEDFAPSRDNQVRMYSCGLTVYARGHIGNFRTFVAVDVLRRALKYQEGFDVQHVMNFTDVDDRTILESNKAGVPLREYTDRYIAAFREDAAALGLETPEQQPRATDEREHHGDGRDDRRAREARAHVSERRIGLLQDLDVSRVRPARAARSLRDQERRACRQRQVREGRRPRFRAVEGEQARRACLGRRLRRRPSRLAHRVLGDGAAPAGSADRSPCRRRRPDFSASRERDRAERGRDRAARSRASGCTSST